MAEKEATAIKEKRNNLQFQYKNKRLALKQMCGGCFFGSPGLS